MKQPTRARLELFLRGVAQRTVAQKAKCSEAYVSRCVNGQQRPSEKVVRAVKEITGRNLFEKEA